MNTETLPDGEFFDQFGDMMTPDEIVRMLDRRCFPEAVAGVYLILKARDDAERSLARATGRRSLFEEIRKAMLAG
jgi:hypothetical protein